MIKVFSTPCKNCLFSKDKIVSNERRRDVLEQCEKQCTYFICHKASMNNERICCSEFYKRNNDKPGTLRIAKDIGYIEFVPMPEHEKLTSFREQKTGNHETNI